MKPARTLERRDGMVAHGSVYPGASRLQDWAYLRRIEAINAERAKKAQQAKAS